MGLFNPQLTYWYRCYQCQREWHRQYNGFWRFANSPDRPQTKCPCCGEPFYPYQQTFNGETTHCHRPKR